MLFVCSAKEKQWEPSIGSKCCAFRFHRNVSIKENGSAQKQPSRGLGRAGIRSAYSYPTPPHPCLFIFSFCVPFSFLQQGLTYVLNFTPALKTEFQFQLHFFSVSKRLNSIWQAPTWSSLEYGGRWKVGANSFVEVLFSNGFYQFGESGFLLIF